MSGNRDLFSENVELSELVLEKTNRAFEQIRKEDRIFMKQTGVRRKKWFQTQAAAAACVGLLAVSGVSAFAAIHHYWGSGMDGMLQASDSEQQSLTEDGVAKVYREDASYASYRVSDQGVTIAPETVIVDEHFAYLTFAISGYSPAEGEETGFESVSAYLGDDPQAEDAWVNVVGTMYDGETDRDGELVYMIEAQAADDQTSLLGKTLNVSFQGLGSAAQARIDNAVDGSWEFALPLSNVSAAEDIAVAQDVADSGFTMTSVRISPISIRVDYEVDEAPQLHEDELGIPEVTGVLLKDGTKITDLTGGGSVGYTDDAKTGAYQFTGFGQVIAVDEVAALLVSVAPQTQPVEIALDR